LKSKKGKVAAVTAAVTAYMEEEKYVRPTMVQRRPIILPIRWSSYGREEIMRMRMLWQRRIVPQ